MAVTTRAVMVDADGAMVAPALNTFLGANGIGGNTWTMAEILPSTTSWPGSETVYYVRVPLPNWSPEAYATVGVKRIRIRTLDPDTGSGYTLVGKVRYRESLSGNSATTYTGTPVSPNVYLPGPDEDDLYADDFAEHSYAGTIAAVLLQVTLQSTGGTAPKGAWIEVEWQPVAA